MSAIRPAAVAGAFYPADRAELSRAGRTRCCGAAGHRRRPSGAQGHHRAARRVHLLRSDRRIACMPGWRRSPSRIKRVVLLGPAHRVAVRGPGAARRAGLRNPAGHGAGRSRQQSPDLATCRRCATSSDAHALEHSLEVHLPVPADACSASSRWSRWWSAAPAPKRSREVLERLWGGDETLIVVSSDLSHYLAYDQAQATDRDTARTILQSPAQPEPLPGLWRRPGQRIARWPRRAEASSPS